MTQVILVRHGQTEWNRVERFRGRADVPLNAAGWAQAELTGQRIVKTWRVAAIYASPLSRAFRTAEAIARRYGLKVYNCPGLIDIDYGRWQGRTPDEVRAEWPELLDAWYRAPYTVSIPGGETLEQVRARALAAVRELASRHEGETIVLVSHVVVNRVILLDALGKDTQDFWQVPQDTCAINLLEVEAGKVRVVLLNDTGHLPSAVQGAAPRR